MFFGKKPMQIPSVSEPNYVQIDIGKRYDVYCSEMGRRTVVYRNALFKGLRRLVGTREFDTFAEFIELEQANGQAVFVSRMSIVKFCEPGVELTA